MTGPVLAGLEAPIRRVVAEHLGVAPEELTSDISLTDDLAADSLDLLEVEVALEDEIGVAVPDAELAELRTFGQLVESIRAHAAEMMPNRDGEAPFVRSRVARGLADAALERAGQLTPYAVQTIAEDALSVGRGGLLELTVPAATGAETVARVDAQFSWLRDRGVGVSVARAAV